MSDLRAAAQAVVNAWGPSGGPEWDWMNWRIDALRAALAQPAPDRTLREAAQAVVDAWEAHDPLRTVGSAVAALRAALALPAPDALRVALDADALYRALLAVENHGAPIVPTDYLAIAAAYVEEIKR